MADPAFPEQAEELKRLLAESHLSIEQMAERAFIKIETLRKYAGGYQVAGKAKMREIRRVAELEMERMGRALGKPSSADALHEDVVRYAGKLLEMTEGKRELAKQLIDELHGTGCHSADIKDKEIEEMEKRAQELKAKVSPKSKSS